MAGIECLSGIPGLVGGTPVQNVGAYGQEVSESIVSVRCFDRTKNRMVELSNAECAFTYRTSIFNTTDRERYVVLAVTYRLVQDGEPKVVYKELVDLFLGRKPSIRETREAVLEIRRAKSMVIDPADPNSLSAGSFFKNPVVSNERYEEISARFGVVVPKFPADTGNVKIPAAWLIENSGFNKGYRLGNAGISTRHTLAIINRGGQATATEVLALKDAIQSGVERKTGIHLQPEPVFIGF
jgi:UDP-N-acetylmuramate dehydrogenase